ncbi:SDR family oxidoreductase [Actinacidiphila sp. bgisy145]|uniref:SDR family oxidoreductase n=1 Tax=Actinacidiphila sp. bgisy145 TaxID=3413792 RepID=UPI003EBB9CED
MVAGSTLVTGGTGTLGRLVVERLRAGGADVRVLSRRSPAPYGVDLRVGKGLDAALEGVGTVVHCASNPRGGDEDAARHLLAACREAGVGHLVYISIVGVDEVPYGYYRSKFAVERLIEESGVGYTVLRATQFHDLVVRVLAVLAKVPVMLLPAGLSDQPVDAGEVADRLAVLAGGPPAGRVPDFGGPEVLSFRDLARTYLQSTGQRRALLDVPLFGRTYRAFRQGGHLAPDARPGQRTFAQFLAAHRP